MFVSSRLRPFLPAPPPQCLRHINMSGNFTNDSHPASSTPQGNNTIIFLYIIPSVTLFYIVLVIPPALFVLYLGIQRWRQQHSVSAAATSSHSDVFTYNMAVVELNALVSYVLNYFSSKHSLSVMNYVSGFIGFHVWFGQMLFPILTCVERYLAVVHPITYLGLRQAGGVRIRNITIGCVWLMSFGVAGLLLVLIRYMVLLPSCFMLVISLVVMTFLSLSVYRVLIRPRPGDGSGDRMQVDKSKQRAVKTIITIMGVLWLKFGCNAVAVVVVSYSSPVITCVMQAISLLFSLPASLTLFLLFLQRAGKVTGCRFNTEWGRGGLAQV